LFGQLDFWVQLLSLAGQILLFGPLLRRLGPMVVLCASPALMIVACCAVGFWPSLPVVAGAMFARRVGEYFVTKPARDLMFTVVPSDAKYTAKNLLDTVVFRAGDALSISAFALLPSSGHDLIAGLIGALLSIVWLFNAAWLAREFVRRSAGAQTSPDAR
jgi:AAA family ATP:ADP antiporter